MLGGVTVALRGRWPTATASRMAAAAAAAALVLGSCGHSRPAASDRLPAPLTPSVLPSGYVLDDLRERPAGPDGRGRWFDGTYPRRGAPRSDLGDALSIHQYLDIDAEARLAAVGGEPTRVRGHPARCVDDHVLGWVETRLVFISVGSAAFTCEQLRAVAESLSGGGTPAR